jgi:hypothetical protein
MVINLNTKLQSMILKIPMKTLKKKDSKRSQCFTEKKKEIDAEILECMQWLILLLDQILKSLIVMLSCYYHLI